MEVVCRCPGCSARFKVDAKYAGRKARCPKCQAVVEVPRENSPAAGPNPTDSVSSVSLTASGSVVPRARPPATPAPPGVSPLNSNLLPPVRAGQPLPQPAAPSPAAPPASIPAPASEAGPAFDFPAISVKKPAAEDPAAAAEKSRPGQKKQNLLPLMIAGGVAIVLLFGVGIGLAVIFSRGSASAVAKKGKSATGGSATLVVDWPGDRGNSQLLIDGKAKKIPPSGEVKFSLAPGSHSLIVRRRGFEPIDESVSLSKGESRTFTPAWKQPPAIAAAPPSATFNSTPNITTTSPGVATPAASSGGGTPFSIGTGVSNSVRGFDRWQQNLDAAQRQAREEQKDILLVFGSSDASNSTQDLARQLADSAVQTFVNSKFVPVIIDFPRTRTGYNQVFDSAQNHALAEEYGIREIPVVVLADEKAKPYAIEREFKDGFDGIQSLLEIKQAERVVRDQFLADAASADEATRIAGAERAVKWLSERKLLGSYENPELRDWLRMAERIDPDNLAGKLEPFFEAQWLVNLQDIDVEDDFTIKAAITAMSPWLTARKFKDPDRAVRLHLIAATLLRQQDKSDAALEHLAQAATYEPKDKDLREAVSGAKVALQNKNVLSTGTGFVISQAGYILTNHHVIEGEGKVVVRMPQTKETIPAEVIAEDADRDMALLKVTFPASFRPGVVPVAPVPSGRGAPVAAFGFPLGDSIGSGLKLTTGVVSAVPDESENNMILLDLRVNPGNSGGPLCDKRGNVIGMITAKTGGLGVDSYGMAIPAVDLIAFLDAHLPATAPRATVAPDGASKEWNEVDAIVSPGVLMILKTK